MRPCGLPRVCPCGLPRMRPRAHSRMRARARLGGHRHPPPLGAGGCGRDADRPRRRSAEAAGLLGHAAQSLRNCTPYTSTTTSLAWWPQHLYFCTFADGTDTKAIARTMLEEISSRTMHGTTEANTCNARTDACLYTTPPNRPMVFHSERVTQQPRLLSISSIALR